MMLKKAFLILGLILTFGQMIGQNNPFDRLNFLIGDWTGTGSGFGNNKSTIESSFQIVMNGNYMEVSNESEFEPTENNPEGEHHMDKGYISFDKSRNSFIFRQFNNEGYVNQYVLNDADSNDTTLIFETESIENFVPNGKARWTIRKISETEIETVFDVSFGNEYACYGTNKLRRKP